MIIASNNKDSGGERMQGWIRTRESALGVRLPFPAWLTRDVEPSWDFSIRKVYRACAL